MTFMTQNERSTRLTSNGSPEQAAQPAGQATAHEIKYRQDAARYVAAMLTELRQIAGKAGFDKLVAAVDAAYYEAYAAQDSQSKPAGENSSNGMEPFQG